MVRHHRATSLALLGCALLVAGCHEDRITAPPKAEVAGPEATGALAAGPRVIGDGGSGPTFTPGADAGPVAAKELVPRGPDVAERQGPFTMAMSSSSSSPVQSFLLWQNLTTGDRGFWELAGPYPNSGWMPLTVIAGNWRVACTADFDGDGEHDILWNNTSTGDWGFWLLQNRQVSARGYIPLTNIASNWKVVACADVNADTKPDLLWHNSTTGDMGFWLMDGTGPSASGYTPVTTIDPVWQVGALADFSGDGKPDILWQNLTTGDRGFWLLNGPYPASGWIPLTVIPGNWKIDDAFDASGDGNTDILWQNSSTGERGWWYLNGTSNAGGWTPMTTIGSVWEVAGVLPAANNCTLQAGDTMAIAAMRDALCRLGNNLPSVEAQNLVKSRITPIIAKLKVNDMSGAKAAASDAADVISGTDPGTGGLPDRDAIVVALRQVAMLP
jgi:hypothetical protein